MAGTDVQIDEKIKTKIPAPKMWKVILLNDDSTPMDFVISILMDIFRHDMASAQHIMLQVHEQGSGVAGMYSFEIAESKATEATNQARTNSFPLQIKLEEE